MLKRDLVRSVGNSLDGYLNQDISQVVDLTLEAITEALVAGRRVEIRGFGSFSIRQRQARTAKNPKTGEVMHIPPRQTLHFTMSRSLKEALVQTEAE